MDINFTPPKLTGTDSEKLNQLERWLAQFLEKLNIALEAVKNDSR